MKARCPAQCGRDLGNGHWIVCSECWRDVPIAMKNEIARYEQPIRQTRNAILKQRYMKLQRSAKERAIQYVIDSKDKEKVSA